MITKTIKKIIASQKVNMGGHIIDQSLPNQHMDQLDPFLLIHHARWRLQGDQRPLEAGIGAHPHRGFSPVTFIFEGDIRHQDSLGNDTVVRAGGTQWMHAGKGITHSERPSKELAMSGGLQEFIQFWVNTPAKYKMEAPYYLPLPEEKIPYIEDDDYKVQIVAGEYNGIKGPARTFSPLLLMRGTIKTEGQLSLSIPASYNSLVYVLKGELLADNQTVYNKSLIWYNTDGEQIQLTAKEATTFILLSGEPIGEKVTSYGPFVMNNQTEIMQALRDAQMGKMGVLIENRD